MSENSSVMLVVKKDGKVFQLKCDQWRAKTIMSPSTDPVVKEILINSLLKQNKSSQDPHGPRPLHNQQTVQPPNTTTGARTNIFSEEVQPRPSHQTLPPTNTTTNTQTRLVSVDAEPAPSHQTLRPTTTTTRTLRPTTPTTHTQTHISSEDVESAPFHTLHATNNTETVCPNQQSASASSDVIKIWKEREEDALVELRHERHDDFLATKNHHKLWETIIKELSKTGCVVSVTQASNKYSTLKKRWKEIIDSPSGSETKYFRHRAAFDNMYGTRISTRPMCTRDTNSDVNKSDDGKAVEHVAKEKKKRKGSVLLECMKEQHREVTDNLEQMHRDKMQRLDRLLDLYEKDIGKK